MSSRKLLENLKKEEELLYYMFNSDLPEAG
jgi:hypothetical protein